jgi:hypothetical protein
MKIFARAANADHVNRLQSTLDVIAMVPILPEDNLLLTLPFAGAVLRGMGAAPEEVNAILETKCKEVLSGKGLKKLEEETTLLQLGVAAELEEDAEAMRAAEDDKDFDGAKESKPKGKKKMPTELAVATAVEEMKKKSPMVAEFIEASCAGSVKGEGDSIKVEMAEVVEPESGIAEPSFE